MASTGTVNKGGSVRLWNVETRKQIALFNTPGVGRLAFSPDGKYLAYASYLGIGGNPVQITLIDVKSARILRTLRNSFATIAFSPDSKRLVAGSLDNLAHVWEAATGDEKAQLEGHTGWVTAAAFSSEGNLLATGSDDMTIRLWETATNKSIKTLKGHTSKIDALAFSPNDSVLASLGSGAVIMHDGNRINLRFDSADKVIRLWNVESGSEISLLKTPGGISNMTFASDWTLLVTGNEIGLIQLWGVPGEATTAAGSADKPSNPSKVSNGKFELRVTRVEQGAKVRMFGDQYLVPNDRSKIVVAVWWESTDPSLASWKWKQSDCTLKNAAKRSWASSGGGFISGNNLCTFFIPPADAKGLSFVFKDYPLIALNIVP